MSRFWAVGVGPGDPDLLTVKAVNVLRAARAIYHAGPRDDRGRALAVVRSLLRPDQAVRTVLTASMPEVSASPGRSAYRPGVEQIAADCRRGLDVAFIAEGDPTLYSTASYVQELLSELFPDIAIEVVPGVSSITAAAARVGWPLAQKDESLAVVPAVYHTGALSALLEQFPTVCFLKAASALPRLRKALAAAGPDRQAVYVENLGTSAEWITHDLEEAASRRDYFGLVLVRRTAPRPSPTLDSTGRLQVVGIGPGDPRLLTLQAYEVLRSVEVILGYEGYVEALRPLHLAAELRGSPIGAEQERAVQALELAKAGKRVALVSSGDAGVYGMASLVLETAAASPGVEVEVVPGVTAALSAAALLGAPLGHDFACISLSDLLTPWPEIERRLAAAGQGDFVVVLYNPSSRRRTWQLPRARDILLQHRGPQTPVGLVARAYRSGASVRQTTLADLSGDGAGMETLVIVGNSRTRVLNGRMVTPRGYGGLP